VNVSENNVLIFLLREVKYRNINMVHSGLLIYIRCNGIIARLYVNRVGNDQGQIRLPWQYCTTLEWASEMTQQIYRNPGFRHAVPGRLIAESLAYVDGVEVIEKD
jgi:hypothetical protein